MRSLVLGIIVLMLWYPDTCLPYIGNDWGQWDDTAKTIYVAGVLEGFKFSAVNLDIPKGVDVVYDTQNEIIKCTEDMTYRQMNAIVKKYMEKHPEEWHMPMSVLVYRAFTGTCGQ
ncbi:MAG TPA: Rap1a/Tai family immunity protein [Nitrospiraceae bacterium]|nr:Rap1a/Tai family immunity protein [Nitrospiraceae bacterium]